MKKGKNTEEFRKLANRPSNELSILFSIAIIIFGIGSIIYSKNKISFENIFIIGIVIISSFYLGYRIKNYRSTESK
ncbi:hypothetical protein HYX04_04060 [Candidatus Woesearchaeota archaeon]|nr:hypothetical protein [Candidatus Woesearchaeota archaeon]